MDFALIESKVVSLIKAVESGTWEAAACITKARSFFEDCKSWERWGFQVAKIKRDDMYRYKRCWEWLCSMAETQSEYIEIYSMEIEYIDAMHRIPPSRFPEFVRNTHEWSSLYRDDLRKAANVFMGFKTEADQKPPLWEQVDFFPKLDASKLESVIADPEAVGRLNFEREMAYSLAFRNRAFAAAWLVKEDQQKLDALYLHLKKDIAAIDVIYSTGSLQRPSE
jgi:hypothetical protein